MLLNYSSVARRFFPPHHTNRVVILNEMIPSLQGIIEMKDLPIARQEAKKLSSGGDL